MSSRRRPVANALTKGIFKSVEMVSLLIATHLPLLAPHVYGKEPRREMSLSIFLGWGRFYIPRADDG
jgi:hypothetical protein